VREEMRRRFGDKAAIQYVNLDSPESRDEFGALVSQIEGAGLLFPVTVIEGEAVYDGSVSYPAILRQVEARLGGAA
jgi:disulfide oxidoreductase YuzD